MHGKPPLGNQADPRVSRIDRLRLVEEVWSKEKAITGVSGMAMWRVSLGRFGLDHPGPRPVAGRIRVSIAQTSQAAAGFDL
jgi:hypothetical protein